MDAGRVAGVVAPLRAALDTVLGCDLSSLSAVEVAELVSLVEVQRRRLESVDQRLVAELGERGVAGEYGRSSCAQLLVELVRITPGEARARVAAARDLGPRRSVTGQPLPPLLEVLAAAQRDGTVSAGHARVIVHCLDRLPAAVAAQVAPVAERMLTEAARHLEPRQLARLGEDLLARVDPDGVQPRERDIARRRGLTLVTRGDGSGVLTGELTAEAAAVWTALLDTLSAPAPRANGEGNEAPERDDRSPAQRRHDGFCEAGKRVLRAGTRGAGSAVATVLVTMTVADLLRGTGYARTAHGDRISVPELLRMAGEADLVPVVLSDTGGILCYGRRRRLASAGQRHALAARDRGCSFPGCTRPPTWCEIHHVVPWQHGGGTDVDNMVLVCGFHHREFERRDWSVQVEDGVALWTPPAWLDPDRRPRRNTAHQLPDVDIDIEIDADVGRERFDTEQHVSA